MPLNTTPLFVEGSGGAGDCQVLTLLRPPPLQYVASSECSPQRGLGSLIGDTAAEGYNATPPVSARHCGQCVTTEIKFAALLLLKTHRTQKQRKS
jgi:hypothetical protein